MSTATEQPSLQNRISAPTDTLGQEGTGGTLSLPQRLQLCPQGCVCRILVQGTVAKQSHAAPVPSEHRLSRGTGTFPSSFSNVEAKLHHVRWVFFVIFLIYLN